MEFRSAEEVELPSNSKILAWYVELGTPRKIIQHCQAAGQRAEFLAEKIDANIKPYVSPKLARALNDVHDMPKTVALNLKKLLHDPTTDTWNIPNWNEFKGWRYLRKNFKGEHEIDVAAQVIAPDFPKFAQIVRQLGSTATPVYLKSHFQEVLIAHYTDWRTHGTTTVPLSERLQYLKKYFPGDNDAWIKRGFKELEIEEFLFEQLPFGPEDLSTLFLQEKLEKPSRGNVHHRTKQTAPNQLDRHQP
jgi:hypothetical protein